MTDPVPTPAPQYRWPRIALACVILFLVACVFFMVKEVRRVERIRLETEDMRKSTLPTNQVPPPPAVVP